MQQRCRKQQQAYVKLARAKADEFAKDPKASRPPVLDQGPEVDDRMTCLIGNCDQVFRTLVQNWRDAIRKDIAKVTQELKSPALDPRMRRYSEGRLQSLKRKQQELQKVTKEVAITLEEAKAILLRP